MELLKIVNKCYTHIQLLTYIFIKPWEIALIDYEMCHAIVTFGYLYIP